MQLVIESHNIPSISALFTRVSFSGVQTCTCSLAWLLVICTDRLTSNIFYEWLIDWFALCGQSGTPFFCDSVRAAGCGDSLTGHLYSGYAACDANSGLILCSESLLSILSNSQVASEYFHCGHIDKIKHLSQRTILVNFFQTDFPMWCLC